MKHILLHILLFSYCLAHFIFSCSHIAKLTSYSVVLILPSSLHILLFSYCQAHFKFKFQTIWADFSLIQYNLFSHFGDSTRVTWLNRNGKISGNYSIGTDCNLARLQVCLFGHMNNWSSTTKFQLEYRYIVFFQCKLLQFE